MVTTRGAEGRVATSSSSHAALLANMGSSYYHVSDWEPFFFPFRPPPSAQGDTTDQSPTTVSAKPLSLSTNPMAEPGLHSTHQCHTPVSSPGSLTVEVQVDVGEDSATSPRRSGRLHIRKKSFSSSATVPDEVNQAVNNLKGKSAGTKVTSSQRSTKLVLRRNSRASPEPASDLTNTVVDTPITPRRSERLFVRSDSHGSPSSAGRRPRRIRIVTKNLREKHRGVAKSKSLAHSKKVSKQGRREASAARRNRFGSASQNTSSTHTDQVPLTTWPEPSTTSAGLYVPQEDLEMEDWEFGEGRVHGSEDGSSSSNLGFAPNFISTRPNIQIRDKVVFSSISIPSGNMQRFEIDPEKTRVCSLISGKVTVQVDGESQFKVGPQGMFPVQPGVSCTVLNNCYAVAVLHVTSVKEGH